MLTINREEQLKHVRASKAKVKKLTLRNKKRHLILYFGGVCARCGYSKCIAALEFHHRDRSKKDFSISSKIHWPMLKLIAEAQKCELLCANCHAEEHFTE